MLKQKKGNAILIVICVFVALIIALGSLVKTTNSRMHTTHLISNTLYVREFANTLSVLSINFLKKSGLFLVLSDFSISPDLGFYAEIRLEGWRQMR